MCNFVIPKILKLVKLFIRLRTVKMNTFPVSVRLLPNPCLIINVTVWSSLTIKEIKIHDNICEFSIELAYQWAVRFSYTQCKLHPRLAYVLGVSQLSASSLYFGALKKATWFTHYPSWLVLTVVKVKFMEIQASYHLRACFWFKTSHFFGT